LKSITI